MNKFNSGGLPPQQPPHKMQLNVPLDRMEDVICACGCKVFIPALKFKRISALVSPSGKEEIAALETMVCVSCREEMEALKSAMG